MSQTQPDGLSNEEILELLQGEPEDVFEKYSETLWAMRADVDSERVRRLIDYVFEKYDLDRQGGTE